MVLDYSKWDALELSDDSDIEVHPNVDKRSFIRAKQNQIHQQRHDRRREIDTLKYERIINDGLLRRIDTLLSELRGHEAEAKEQNAFIYQALITSAGDPDDDEPPKPPEGVHTKEEQPRYSQMMGQLMDQVKKEVDEAKADDWYRAYLKGIEGHRKKVIGLQKELVERLNLLEKEEGRKITSDSIHTGFNTSFVSKEKEKSAKIEKKEAKTVEVLNSRAFKRNELQRSDSAQSSGADADIEEAAEDDEQIEPSELGKKFAAIKPGDYRACLQFISENRAVLAERETDALLMEGFEAQMKGKQDYAKQCVHQALLLQYCRTLGKDGVGLFFKRITTPGHQAQKVFLDDVESTYLRIKTRTAELIKERAANPEEAGVETIQLHAVDPGTEITFNIPQPGSEDPVKQASRQVFESFSPGMQRALESGELDRVNEVLGKMSVEEAEELVGQLAEAQIMSMEKGVIDGTTEEGQQQLRDLEKQAGLDKDGRGEADLADRMEEVQIADPD
ncbi:hsp90 co-chaperone Cdc37 [Varicellaria rhodocarpa]|nr:hsp90 co-chaperone Cdc37 [Varicellaria rhodocarpa]